MSGSKVVRAESYEAAIDAKRSNDRAIEAAKAAGRSPFDLALDYPDEYKPPAWAARFMKLEPKPGRKMSITAAHAYFQELLKIASPASDDAQGAVDFVEYLHDFFCKREVTHFTPAYVGLAAFVAQSGFALPYFKQMLMAPDYSIAADDIELFMVWYTQFQLEPADHITLAATIGDGLLAKLVRQVLQVLTLAVRDDTDGVPKTADDAAWEMVNETMASVATRLKRELLLLDSDAYGANIGIVAATKKHGNAAAKMFPTLNPSVRDRVMVKKLLRMLDRVDDYEVRVEIVEAEPASKAAPEPEAASKADHEPEPEPEAAPPTCKQQ